jgi:hypothetical protein
MAAEKFSEEKTPSTGTGSSAGETRAVTEPSMGNPPNASQEQNTGEVAKEQARGVAQQGIQAGEHVATVATDQAKEVAAEAGQQARSLLRQARTELTESLASQQNRVADALHALSKELGSMASRSEQEGLATNLASQASRQVGGVAHWVSEREPGTLVTELKDLARNKPGTFLAAAAGIGLVAGRVTRATQAGPADKHGNPDQRTPQESITPDPSAPRFYTGGETIGEQFPMATGLTP